MNKLLYPEVKNFLHNLKTILNSLNITDLNFLTESDEPTVTRLHQAVTKNDLQMVVLILEIAKKSNNDDKLKLLNAQDKNGNTAMHIVAKNNYVAIGKLLEKEGANLKIQNNNNEVVNGTELTNTDSTPNSGNTLIKSSSKDVNVTINMLPTSLSTNDLNFNVTKAMLSSPSTAKINNNITSIGSDAPPINIDARPENLNSNLNKALLSSTQSEYRQRLLGGSKNLNNITSEVSVENTNFRNSKLIENFNTEISIDNLKKNIKLTDVATDVSIDHSVSGGSSSGSSSVSSSVSSTTESPSGSSSGSSVNTSSSSDVESSSQSVGQRGGGKLSESSELSDTSAFVKSLLTQFNGMKGGARKSEKNSRVAITGMRRLPSLSDHMNMKSEDDDHNLSREQMKESSNIHDQVVKMFMDAGKSEEDARIIKMALYKYTKDHNQDLNNLDRAKQMLEYAADKKIVKGLDLEATRKVYDEIKKSRNMASSESSNKSSTESSNKSSSQSSVSDSSNSK